MVQHLLLFHDDLPSPWLKTLAKDCKAAGIERLGGLGFRLRAPQRADLVAAQMQQDAPADLDWALVPASRQVTDFALIACDMDATLIENECVDELAAWLPDPAPVLASTRAAMEGSVPVAESLRERVRALRGLPETAIAELLADHIRLRPGAERLMRLARTAGWQIVLTTGGFMQFAQPVAERLGITRVLCNRLDIEAGRICGTFSGDILDADSKALALERSAAASGIPMRRVVMLGDGANDAESMRRAGLSIGIRPKPMIGMLATHSLHHAPLDAVWYLAGGS